jgi:hypothetical protein
MLKKVSIICFAGFISACGGGSDSRFTSSNFDTPDTTIEAPDSIKGISFTQTIESGSGLFATQGKFVTTYSASSNTYITVGDGVNVANSAGTYTYNKNAKIGTINIIDSVISTGATCKFTFSTLSSGSYSCIASSNSNFVQNGTFTSS